MSKFELRQIEVFSEIVKCKNFSAAARSLYLSQSTVSAHVKNLETNLGIPLFDRAGQQLTLTAAGAKFSEYATQILSLVEQSEDIMQKYKKGSRGILTIQAAPSTYARILPHIVSRFSALYPDVQILLNTSFSPEITNYVSGDIAKVGIIRMPVPIYNDPRFKSIFLSTDTSSFITAPDHYLAKKKCVCMADIAAQPILFFGSNTNYWVQVYHAFSELGLQPYVAMNVDELSAIKTMVSLGMGVTFLPTQAVQDYVISGKVVEVPVMDCPEMNRHSFVIYKEKNLDDYPLKMFVSFLQKMLSNNNNQLS